MSTRIDKAQRSPLGTLLDPNRRKGKYEAAAEALLGETLQHRVTSYELRDKRNAQIIRLYGDFGWSMQDVGWAFDLSRERIRQILTGNVTIRPQFGGSQKKVPQ